MRSLSTTEKSIQKGCIKSSVILSRKSRRKATWKSYVLHRLYLNGRVC